MESTEGMVAIVQGLQDAGLTVTVTDARQLDASLGVPQRSRAQVPGGPTRSSGVQTYGPTRAQSSVQLCSSPYKSTYQYPQQHSSAGLLAQSRPRHSSNQLQQFRTNSVSRGQDSLDSGYRTISRPISAYPAGHPSLMPVRDIQPHRTTAFIWDERTAVSTRSSRATDAFVDSLRKYPYAERSTSADLIQRLLSFTQTKNCPKTSNQSKSVRSFIRQSSPERREAIFPARNSSKNIQTYTRIRQESPPYDVSSIYGKPERRKRVVSPVRSERGGLSTTRQPTMSYDYLKIGSRVSQRATDVRYLNDVTKYVRDTLRQMTQCDGQGAVCPQIASRYNEHRRSHHHRNETGTETREEMRERIKTTSTRAVSARSPFHSPSGSGSIRHRCDSDCIRHKRPKTYKDPCECIETELKQSRSPRQIRFKALCKELVLRPIDVLDECPCPEEIGYRIEIVVDAWLREIPVYANYSEEDEKQRVELVKDLKAKLKRLVGDAAKGNEEIMSFLDVLPMWLPPDSSDHRKFKEDLVDKLMRQLNENLQETEKIKEIVRKWVETIPFKPEPIVDKDAITSDMAIKIVDIFEMTDPQFLRDAFRKLALGELLVLPIDFKSKDKCKLLSELADRLADVLLRDDFGNTVHEWVETIPLEQVPFIDKGLVADNLIAKLRNTAAHSSPEDRTEAMRNTAVEEINQLPINCDPSQKDQVVSELTGKLAGQLAMVVAKEECSKTIEDWVNALPLKSEPPQGRDVLAKDLEKEIFEIIDNTDPCDQEEAVTYVVGAKLQKLSIDCDPVEKDKVIGGLAKNLATKLVETTQKAAVEQAVEEWIPTIPLQSGSPVDRSELTKEFVRELNNVPADIDPTERRNVTFDYTTKKTSDLPIDCDPSKKGAVTEDLAIKLANKVVKSKFSNVVRDWLDTVPLKVTPGLDKDRIAADMTKDLDYVIGTTDPEKVKDALKNAIINPIKKLELDCETTEKDELTSTLADKLVNDLISTQYNYTVFDWAKTIPIKPNAGFNKRTFVDELTGKLVTVNETTPFAELRDTLKDTVHGELVKLPVDCEANKKEELLSDLAGDLADSLVKSKFSKTIQDWVKKLPFEPGETVDKDRLTTDLTDTLKNIASKANKDNMQTELKDATFEELEKYPVEGDTSEKGDMAQKLAEKLAKLPKKISWLENLTEDEKLALEMLKKRPEFANMTEEEIRQALKELSETIKQKRALGLTDEEIMKEMKNEVDDYITKIKVQQGPKRYSVNVSSWMQGITSSISKQETEKLLKNVLATLRQLRTDGVETELVQERIKEEIDQHLRNIAKARGSPMDEETQKTLSSKLYAQVFDSGKNQQKPRSASTSGSSETSSTLSTSSGAKAMRKVDNPKQVKKEIKNWIEDIPELKSAKENETLTQALVNKIDKIHSRDLNDKQAKRKIRNEIKNKLDAALDNQGEKMDEKSKQKLANKLVEKLAETVDNSSESATSGASSSISGKPSNVQKAIKNEIQDWIEDIPELKSAKENENLTQALVNKIDKINIRDLNDTQAKRKIQNEIKNKLDAALDNQGQKMDEKSKQKLANKLVEKLAETVDNSSESATSGTSNSIGGKSSNVQKAIKNEIQDWIEDIPELKSKTVAEKKENEKIVQNMSKKVSELQDKGLDDIALKREIKGALENAIDKKGENLNYKTKNQLADALVDRLTKTLNKLETGSVAKSDKKDSRQSADLTYYVERIPELSAKTPSEKKANEQLTKDLTKKYTNLQSQGLNDDQIKNKMVLEIKDYLDSAFEDKGKRIDPKTKNKIADQLLDKLAKKNETESAKKRSSDNLSKKDSPKVKKEVKEWVNKIPELKSSTPAEKKENENLMNTIVTKYTELKTHDLDSDEIKEKMQKEIISGLDKTLENKGEEIGIEKKLQLANTLLDKLESVVEKVTSTVSFASEPKAKPRLSKVFKNDITDWVEKIPELKAENSSERKKNKKLIRDLTKEFNTLQSRNLDNPEVRKELATEIKDKLDTALQQRGEKTDSKTKNMLADMLLEKIKNSIARVDGSLPSLTRQQSSTGPSSRSSSEATSVSSKKVKPVEKAVSDWVEQIPELSAMNSREKKENKRLSNELAQKLTEVGKNNAQKLEDIKQEMAAALKNRGEFIDMKARNNLAEKLLTNVIDIANKSEILGSKLEHDVKEFIEEIPELSNPNPYQKRQLNTIAQELARNLKTLTANDLKDKNTKKSVLDYIKQEISKAFEVKNEPLDSKTEQKLAEKLLKKVEADVKQIETNLNMPEVIEKSLNKWMQNMPEVAGDKAKMDKVSKALSKKIGDVYSKGVVNQDSQDRLLEKITGQLDAEFGNSDDVSAKAKNKLAVELLGQLNEGQEKARDKALLDIKDEFILASKLKGDFDELKTKNLTTAPKMVDDEAVNKVLKEFPEISGNRTLTKAIENIEKDIKKRLRDSKDLFSNKKQKKQNLQEIKDQIEEVCQAKGEYLDPKTMNKLAEKLLDNIIESHRQEAKATTSSDQEKEKYSDKETSLQESSDEQSRPLKKVAENVENWIKEIPELAGSGKENDKADKRMSKALANIITDLETKGIDKNTEKKVLSEIKEVLDPALKSKRKKLHEDVKDDIAENLKDKVIEKVKKDRQEANATTSSDQEKENYGDKETSLQESSDEQSRPLKKVAENVENWIKEIPELAGSGKENDKADKRMSKALANIITDLETKGIDKNTEKKVVSEIKEVLDPALKSKRKKLHEDVKDDIAENLKDKVIEKVKKDRQEAKATTSSDQEKEKYSDKETSLQESSDEQSRPLKKVAENVENWIKEIPELAGSGKENDKADRMLSKALANIITDLKTKGIDKNTEKKVLSEIKEVLDPALKSKRKKLHEDVKDDIAENLKDKVIEKVKKGRQEAKATTSSDQEKEKYSDKETSLQESSDEHSRPLKEVAENVENWIKEIPELAGSGKENDKADKRMSKALANIITDLKTKGIDKNTENKVLSEIKEVLDPALKSKRKKLHEDVKDDIAENLKDKVIEKVKKDRQEAKATTSSDQEKEKYGDKETSLQESSDEHSRPLKEVAENVENWIKEIPELAGSGKENDKADKRMSKALANIITDLETKGIDKNTEKKVLSEIKEVLDPALKSKRKKLHEDIKDDIAENLKDKVIEKVKKADVVEEALKEDIKSVFGTMSELPNTTKYGQENLNNLSEKLAKSLKQLGSEDLHNPQVRNKILADIKRELKVAFDNKGKPLDAKTKAKIAETLLQTIEDSMERGERQAELPKVLQDDISAWVEQIPELQATDAYEKTENNRLSRALANDLANLKPGNVDDKQVAEKMLKTIKNTLHSALDEKGEHVDAETREEMAQKLLNNVINTTKKVHRKSDQLERDFENKIQNWFETSPELPKTAVDKKFVSKLCKDLASDLSKMDKQTNLSPLDKAHRKVQTVRDFLNKYLRKNDIKLEEKTKQKLVDKLVKDLAECKDKSVKNKDEQKVKTEIEQAIADWHNDIAELSPGIASDKQMEKMTQELTKKVNNIHRLSKTNGDFKDQIKRAVSDHVANTLNQQGEDLDRKTKNKLVDKLVHKLAGITGETPNTPRIDEKFPTDTTMRSEKSYSNKKTSDKFKDFIEPKIENDPTGKVLGKIYEGPVNTNVSEVLQKNVADWLDEIPELAGSSPRDRRASEKLKKTLVKKLADLQSRGVDDDDVRQDMLEEIKEQLDDSLEMKGEYVPPTVKNKLAEKLLNKIVSSTKEPKSKLDTDTSQSSLILDWFDKIPALAGGGKAENIRHVEKLKQKIRKIQKKPVGDGYKKKEIEKEVTNWLKDVENQKGSKIDEKTKEKLAKKLANSVNLSPERKISSSLSIGSNNGNIAGYSKPYSGGSSSEKLTSKMKARPVPKKSGNAKDFRPFVQKMKMRNGPQRRSSFDKKSEVYYVKGKKNKEDDRGHSRSNLALNKSDSIKEISRDIDPDVQEQIKEIIADNIHIIGTPAGNKKVQEKVLETLMNQVGLPEDEAETFTNHIMKQAKIRALEIGKEEMQLLDLIKGEIRGFIHEYNVRKEKQADLEAYLTELVSRKLLHDELDEDTRDEILATIQVKGDLSREQAEELLDRVLGQAERMMSSPAINRSISRIKRRSLQDARRSSLTLREETIFESKARKIITDFIYENVTDPTPKQQEKIKKVINATLENIEEILTDPELNGDIKRKLMKDELCNQLCRISFLSSDIPVTELAEDLLSKLEDIDLKTSTPKRNKRDSNQSDRRDSAQAKQNEEINKRDSKQSDRRDSAQAKQNEEEYGKKLEGVITNWLDDLPIDPDVLKDEEFKATIIKDLAGDIIDRQKYLQLNPDVQTTDAEELDNLQYQCYRWMNKFLSDDDLNTAVDRADELLEAIKRIIVPRLVKSSDKTQGKMPTYIDALQEEIMDWAKSIQPAIMPTVNDKEMEKHVKDLADKINMNKGKPDAEDKIRKDIAYFLPNVYENLDKSELKRLESSLFNLLLKKGFTNNTWTPQKGVEDKLNGAVQDWLKQLPCYQNASPEEKKAMELAATQMAKGIQEATEKANLNPDTFDATMQDELMKLLENVIKNPELLNDKEFMKNTADSLLNHLKEQPVFQNLSGHAGTPPVDFLTKIVDDWVDSLSIDVKTAEENKRLEDAKKDLVTKLKRIRQQSPHHDQALKDEIKKFLRSNLTDTSRKRNENYLEAKANELVKLLRGVPMQSSDDVRDTGKLFKNAADTLYEYIEHWCKELPLQGDPEKVQLMKQNLASKLMNKTNELNMIPDILNDEVLYEDLLRDEVDKLLDELPGNPELDKYLPALTKDLISKIMDARQMLCDELAGKAYKQQLREKVSTSFYIPDSLSPDEQASFEMLKDKLADAFINLQYSRNSDDDRFKYKKTVSEEVDRFCNDILRRYPCLPLDPCKIKQDLHHALLRVPPPKDDTMRSEIEQIRIRDILNEWMKEIPLRQETATERLHRHKLATILAKHLHEIELEKEMNPYMDTDSKMEALITRFLKKLALRGDADSFIPELTVRLIHWLKNSEQSRKFDSKRLFCTGIQTETYDRYPCTLSRSEKSHLMRIKERAAKAPCYPDITACPPMSRDSCSQTDNREECRVPQRTKRSCQTSPPKKDAACMTPTQSTCHISPRIIVKEYVWDSTNTTEVPCTTGYLPRRNTMEEEPMQVSQGSQTMCPMMPPQNTTPPRNIPPPICEAKKTQRGSQSQQIPMTQQTQSPPYAQPGPSQCMNSCGCCAHQEKDIPCTSQAFAESKSPDVSSGEDLDAEPRPFWRPPCTSSMDNRPYCHRDQKRKSRTRCEDCDSDWSTGIPMSFPEDFDEPCWRHRGKRTSSPFTRKRERTQEKSKCKCKERILVSCSGRNGNQFRDMCRTCGSSCPHPSYLYFRK